MSSEELRRLIAEVRDSRKRPKKEPKATSVKKNRKKKGAPNEADMEALVNTMTDSERAAFIAMLEDM